MMTFCRSPRLLAAILVPVSVLAAPRGSEATVLVPMADAELVAASSLVLIGDVTRVRAVMTAENRIVTRVTLAVEETLKGATDEAEAVVTVPGGWLGGRGVWVDGAPRFDPGERVLVFLRRAGDETLRTTAMSLGKYRVAPGRGGRQMALPEYPRLDARDLDRFRERVRALAQARPAAPSRVYGRSGVRSGVDGDPAFRFLGPARWFEADDDMSVNFRVANSDANLGTAATAASVADALAAWTGVGTASIVLGNGGAAPVALSAASGECDGVSTIQFNDPFDEMPDLSFCEGVFAVSGIGWTEAARTFGANRFFPISEADLTVNIGTGACVTRTADFTETVAHEMGHMIGLNHSSENPLEQNTLLREALMFVTAHHDGRGAALNADDIGGLEALYPEDDDGDGVPDAEDACPSTRSGFQVDARGCDCTDKNGSGCDDGDPCTIGSCDTTSGACTQSAVDCADEEPCTADSCDSSSGQCVNELKGDTDGDGLCDPADNCPLQADADPTDANGDGVGDVCECADTKPGRCVRGNGARSRRCIVEWLPKTSPPLGGRGVPRPRLVCTDGDPGCDEDGIAGQCTFSVALCVSNRDPRLKRCEPSFVSTLVIRSPKPNPRRFKNPANEANATAIKQARGQILSEKAHNRCSAFMPIVVPRRGAKKGVRFLKVAAVTDDGNRGRATLKLGCRPMPAEG